MTKQEEIREGVADCLPGAGDTTTNLWDTVDRILNYLDSQGVVIKVAGPPYETNCSGELSEIKLAYFRYGKESVVFESLIKE